MCSKDIDTRPVTFGKYKGKTPEQIAVEDPSYLIWMFTNVKPRACSELLYNLTQQDMCEGEILDAEDMWWINN